VAYKTLKEILTNKEIIMKHIPTFNNFINEARMKTTYKHSDVVLFSIDDDKLDQILNDKFARNLDFEDIKGDSYYSLPRREFDRFIDLADSSGFDVDYEGSEDSVIDVIEK
jgi:hypothetical protein